MKVEMNHWAAESRPRQMIRRPSGGISHRHTVNHSAAAAAAAVRQTTKLLIAPFFFLFLLTSSAPKFPCSPLCSLTFYDSPRSLPRDLFQAEIQRLSLVFVSGSSWLFRRRVVLGEQITRTLAATIFFFFPVFSSGSLTRFL